MPGSPLSSYLGNITSQRQKLSAVRQRLGLEPSSPTLRELAPSPPNGPSFKRIDAGTDATEQLPQEMFDPNNHQIPDAQRQQMLAMIDQHLASQQQQQQPEQPAPGQPMPPGAPQQGMTQVTDQRTLDALAPLADFFKENGRMPNPEELKNAAAANQLKQTLGRQPTNTETALYRAPPPKEVKAVK